MKSRLLGLLFSVILISVSGFFVMNQMARNGAFTSLSRQLMHLTFAKEVELQNDIDLTEGSFTYALDEVEYYSESNILLVRGWIIKRGSSSIPADRIVILSSESLRKAYQGLTTSRGDVTRSIGDGIDYDAAGFDTLIPISDLQPGTYSISIALISEQTQVVTNYVLFIDETGDVLIDKS